MTNGGLLTAEQILSTATMRTAYVEVPEWGGTVKVRSMTGQEREQYRNSLVRRALQRVGTQGNPGETEIDLVAFRFDGDLVAKCCIDEDGKRIFTDAQVEALGHADPQAVERVAAKIKDLSGMSREGAEEIAGESGAEARPETS